MHDRHTQDIAAMKELTEVVKQLRITLEQRIKGGPVLVPAAVIARRRTQQWANLSKNN